MSPCLSDSVQIGQIFRLQRPILISGPIFQSASFCTLSPRFLCTPPCFLFLSFSCIFSLPPSSLLSLSFSFLHSSRLPFLISLSCFLFILYFYFSPSRSMIFRSFFLLHSLYRSFHHPFPAFYCIIFHAPSISLSLVKNIVLYAYNLHTFKLHFPSL